MKHLASLGSLVCMIMGLILLIFRNDIGKCEFCFVLGIFLSVARLNIIADEKN